MLLQQRLRPTLQQLNLLPTAEPLLLLLFHLRRNRSALLEWGGRSTLGLARVRGSVVRLELSLFHIFPRDDTQQSGYSSQKTSSHSLWALDSHLSHKHQKMGFAQHNTETIL